MDFDWNSIAGSAGGAVSVGSILFWAFKAWSSSVNKKLDEHTKTLHQIELDLANRLGKDEAQQALLWREINTDKQKIIQMQSKVDKAWEVIGRIAQPRISDLLKKEDEK